LERGYARKRLGFRASTTFGGKMTNKIKLEKIWELCNEEVCRHEMWSLIIRGIIADLDGCFEYKYKDFDAWSEYEMIPFDELPSALKAFEAARILRGNDE